MATLRKGVKIQNPTYPDKVQPDIHQGSIKIRNYSDETVYFRVSGTVLNENGTVIANGTTVLNHSYSVGTQNKDISIKITDRESGKVLDEYSKTVKPYGYVDIDTSRGEVETVGGFDEEVKIESKIIGLDIASIGALQDDRPIPTYESYSLDLDLDDTLDPRDALDFNRLEMLDAVASKKMVWFVDGDNKGRTTTFRYTSYVFNTYSVLKNLNIPTERYMLSRDPNINVVAGPTKRVGSVRSRLGIGGRILGFSSLSEKLN